MRTILTVGLAMLGAAAPLASATSFEFSESQEFDAVALDAALAGNVASAPQEPKDGLFSVDAGGGADVTPTDSVAASTLEPFVVNVLPAVPEPVAPVASEARAVWEEGASAQAQAHADEAEASVSYSAQAGSQSVSGGQSVEAPPLEGSASRPMFRDLGAQPGPEPAAPAPPEVVTVEESANVEPAAQTPVAESPSALPTAVAATLAVAGAATSAAFAFAPGWRTALVKLAKKAGALALFSRIAQEDLLHHERRSELLEFVRHNPGERVETARRALGFSNGSMHYHLRVLVERGLLRLFKDGAYARLYPAGPKIAPVPYVSPQRRRFLDLLCARPGMSQRDLADALALSERMVSYHVRALHRQGLLDVQAEGHRKRLFPKPVACA